MPDVGVQIPPNLSDWWLPLVEEGATDLGGLSANGDHISPEHPFPSVHRMRKRLAPQGYALTERLCVYPQYMDAEWIEQGVLDVIKLKYWSFIPRRGSGRREERADPARPGPGRDREGPRRRAARARRSSPRCSPRRGPRRSRTCARRPTSCARARRRDGHVRGEPQHQRVERLHRRLRVLRLRPGQALARRLRARPRGVRAARARGGGVRRHRDLHAVGHPSRLGARGLRALAAGGEGGGAPASTCTRTRRWRSSHMCDISGLRAARGVRAAARGRPGLHAGHRRRGAPRRRARADLAEQAARGALGGGDRGLARRRPALHRHGDVRPRGGALGAGRAHARGARAAGAHRRLHRVRAAVLHPVPHAARAHARDRGDLDGGEPQAHRRRSASRSVAACRASRPAG